MKAVPCQYQALRTWRAPLPMLLVLALGLPGVTRASAGDEGPEECHALIGDPPTLLRSRDIDVRGLTARERFVLPEALPNSIDAIACVRDSLIPADHDYRVLLAGYPLALRRRSGETAWLEVKHGKLDAAYSEGALKTVDTATLQAGLDQAQRAIDAAGAYRAKTAADPADARAALVQSLQAAASQPLPACQTGHPHALDREQGVVTIHPGETLCVRLEIRGEAVVPTAIVEVPGSDTLILRAWRERSDSQTNLALRNPFDGWLHYKAFIARPGAAGVAYTTTCPLSPRKFGLENWPFSLDALRLGAFARLPPSAEPVCE